MIMCKSAFRTAAHVMETPTDRALSMIPPTIGSCQRLNVPRLRIPGTTELTKAKWYTASGQLGSCALLMLLLTLFGSCEHQRPCSLAEWQLDDEVQLKIQQDHSTAVHDSHGLTMTLMYMSPWL